MGPHLPKLLTNKHQVALFETQSMVYLCLYRSVAFSLLCILTVWRVTSQTTKYHQNIANIEFTHYLVCLFFRRWHRLANTSATVTHYNHIMVRCSHTCNKKCGHRIRPHGMPPPASNDRVTALGQDDSDWSCDLATLEVMVPVNKVWSLQALPFGRYGTRCVSALMGLVTLKPVCELHLRWGTFLPNLGTLGLWVLKLFPMYATDGWPLPYVRGHNNASPFHYLSRCLWSFTYNNQKIWFILIAMITHISTKLTMCNYKLNFKTSQ